MTDPVLATVHMMNVGGQRLRVAVRAGDPRRTPLMLCNGIGAGLECFDACVEALDPSIPVIRFDPPGAGGSPLPATPYRLPGLARTALKLVDLLGYPQVDVLGISWGGALAQQIARTGRGRCRRLVLVATGNRPWCWPVTTTRSSRWSTGTCSRP